MAEKMKRRVSKWDMEAELHVETVGQDSAVPAAVDDPCMDLTEVDSIKPILSMNVHGSEINQSASQSGEETNNNIVHSDDFCEKIQYSEQFDLEGDCKDGFKKHDWEPASQDRTMAECAENQEKPCKAACDLSPGPEERHHKTPNMSPIVERNAHNMSPIDERNRPRRKRSRSGSLSHDLRNRSRSRSKSPSSVSKQDSDRWTDKGRTRVRTPPCRAFAAGKCRWGNECRFLHEDGGWGQTERHHDAESTEGMGSKSERERQLVFTTNESHADTPEKRNYSQERPFRRPEEHHEDGWRNNNAQGYRFNERCFDFTRGRCYRGAACRYIHDDASSDGGWSARDESRGRVYDNRRDGNESFNRRPEHQRLSDVPCKYFLRGHCVHGDGCKFYHQVGPPNSHAERSLDGGQHSFVSGDTSVNSSVLQDRSTRYRPANPRGESKPGVGDIPPMDRRNFSNRSVSNIHPGLTHDTRKETHPSEQKTTMAKVSEEVSSDKHLPNSSAAGQNAEIRGQRQLASQLLHSQSFASNSSFQQFAPPFPLKGPMQQGMRSNPQNEKNQFAALHKPPDDHSFNAKMENLSANPSCYQLNAQNLDSIRQAKQNLPMMSHHGGNFNLKSQIQLNGPSIHNAQNQPDLSVGAQIQQNLASSRIGHGHQDTIGAGDSQQILPQSVQSQAQSFSPHVSNGQNHPRILNSEENCESTMKSNSMQIGQGTDSLEVKPPFNSDNSVTHKVVTIEQAAKITDLSASLAQFFGTAARNSQPSSTITPQAFLNPIGSFVTIVEPPPPPTEIEGSQTNPSLSTPKPNQQTHIVENIKQADDSSSREAKKAEARGITKDQPAQLQNDDAAGKKDGDGRKIKEAKEMRMFKCALVEFVKEILKPKWKEGQLSKEAYKTIVKKVVDKVCGSLQGPNVPQTQEKIDLYLLNSKAKLSKLVQAYVEKFVNS